LLGEDSKPDQLEKELKIWYDYKQKQNLITIQYIYKAFQEKVKRDLVF
jgi:hypothetical protein